MKLILEWTYRTKGGATTTFTSAQLTPHEALLFAEDIEKTGRVKQLTITDEHDSTWMMKELKKYIKELETEPHDITIYFDGSFDHYSNSAGLGIVVFFHAKRIRAIVYVKMRGLIILGRTTKPNMQPYRLPLTK